MRSLARLLLAPVLLLATSVGCSQTAAGEDLEGPDATTAVEDAGSIFEGGFRGDAPDPDAPPVYPARLAGKVFAPEGTIPISGALVYLTPTKPDPIPDHTYCDQCVPLPPTTPYDVTNADGTFSLKGLAGRQFLVVQKGAFRRVRSIELRDGSNDAPTESTTLPAENGDDDTIPKIAVISGGGDRVENTLSKLGLGMVDKNGEYMQGSGSFDVFYEATSGPRSQSAILDHPEVLAGYHVVFRPCSIPGDGFSSNPDVIARLRDFVVAGGKFYVTCCSYEYVHQGWPALLDFRGQNTFGEGCGTGYDVPVTKYDPGLGDWLTANGVDPNELTLYRNYAVIDAVHSVQGPSPDGGTTSITPKTWIESDLDDGGTHPNTISFEYGCGRVLFSTYHTVGLVETGLMPQELALLYVLLEVNVCSGPPIVKPPPN